MDLSNINKKLFKYVFMVVGAIVGIIIIFAIVKIIIGTKLSFSKIEDKMVSAAKAYYNDSKIDAKLPVDGGTVSVSVDTLVQSKKMKKISKYTKKGVQCSGEVIVENNGGEYYYVPSLDCGKDYKTTSLSDYIIKNEPLVSESDGLYSLYNEYIYRGEYVNNYVKFNNQLWRIIKIDVDGNVKLLQDSTKLRSLWDDRFNNEKISTVGINDYTVSRIEKFLNDKYEETFSDSEKAQIASKDLCIGKRYNIDETKDGSTECSEKYPNQKIGLLQANEFLVASIDKTCLNIKTNACQNYNYLAKYGDPWWTLTPVAGTTFEVYENTGRQLSGSNGNITRLIRMVIYLNKNVIYTSGDGTKENPYVFK